MDKDLTYRTCSVQVTGIQAPAAKTHYFPKGVYCPDENTAVTISKTFYLAASSKDLASVRRKAADLLARHHLWYGGMDWTNYVDNMPEPFYGAVTAMDLAAAVHADLFVLVLDTANVSFGASAEYGARLTSGKIANVVSAEKKHPFLFHTNTRWWPTWEAFLAGGLK